jgi:hypothetical protein
LSLPSQQASPSVISRSDLACASWQNIIATNWLQQAKPLAAFSARHSLTRRANWCRLTSKSSWLKRLECPTISPASVDGFLARFAYQRFNQKRRPFCQFFFRTLLGLRWVARLLNASALSGYFLKAASKKAPAEAEKTERSSGPLTPNAMVMASANNNRSSRLAAPQFG